MSKKLYLLAIVLFALSLIAARGVVPASYAPPTPTPCGGSTTTTVGYNTSTGEYTLVMNGRGVATATLDEGVLSFGAYGQYGVTYRTLAGSTKLDLSAPLGWYKVGSNPLQSSRIQYGCK